MAKKFKFNIIKTVITIICLIILGTIGRDVFFRHFFNERLTVIPNVVNLHEKDAVKYLKEAGLKVKVIHSKTEKVPLDTVFIQFPLPGKEVKVNRTIQIWVNNGEGQEVPNLVGLELLEARSLLQGQNIQIEKIDYQPSNQRYNTIIGVYPTQKILDASVMPNLIGLDINDAKVLLTQIGLTLGGTTKGEDPTLPVNTIMSTSPAPGAKISKGQKISIVINAGVKVQPTGPSVEEIINQTNQDLNNQEIENIINDTLNKIDKRDNSGNNNNNQQQQNNNPGADTERSDND